jgi:pimeloyl-ACP methyl ester carboxylesterase
VGRFALRRGAWRWALDVATERPGRPVGLALPDGRALGGRWCDAPSGRIHVRASPARDRAVVLVHGVIVSSRYLMPLGVELAADLQVLIPDLPGYGLSEPPRGPLTLATLADAVVELAAAAGHDRVALVGNSFGAQIVVEAAVRHPERVARIALLGPTVDPAARTLLRQYVRWQRGAVWEHPSAIPLMARDVVDVGVPRALRLLRVMLADRVESKIPAVACPALVVRGDHDHVAPARWARVAAGLAHDCRLATVPGYGHMAHYSGALAVAPILRDFLLED